MKAIAKQAQHVRNDTLYRYADAAQTFRVVSSRLLLMFSVMLMVAVRTSRAEVIKGSINPGAL